MDSRHYGGMKLTHLIYVFAAMPAFAQDFGGVHALISELNRCLADTNSESFSGLFTGDADLQTLGGRIYHGRKEIAEALAERRIWNEVTPPRLVDETIRFITAEVALVDARQVEYGSLALGRSVPVLLVARYRAGRWAIASMRILTPGTRLLPIGPARRRD